MNSKKVIDSIYYKFSPTTKTITFDSILNLSKKDILLITNLSVNKILYNFACEDEGGAYSNHVLDLKVSTAGMSENDVLMVTVIDTDKKEEYLSKILEEIRTTNELIAEFIKERI